MSKKRILKCASGLLAAAVVSLSSGVQAEDNYVMGTATTGGLGAPIIPWVSLFQR